MVRSGAFHPGFQAPHRGDAAEALIDRTPEVVWRALTDWRSAPEWMNGIDRMQAHGDTIAGTRLTFHARGMERQSSILRCDPGRSITLRSVQGSVTADYTYALQPEEQGKTRSTLTATCQARGFWWRLLFPALKIAIRMVDGRQPAQLKFYVEAN